MLLHEAYFERLVKQTPVEKRVAITPESTHFEISRDQHKVKIDWKDGTITNWYCEKADKAILLQNPSSGYFVCQSEFEGVGINAIWKDGEKIWKVTHNRQACHSNQRHDETR